MKMNTELRALATLLIYPRHQTQRELESIARVLQSSRHIDPHSKENLKSFINALSSAPLRSLQNVYLASFENGEKTLNLSTSNKASDALGLLEKLYRNHGQNFDEKEVPNFLPAILEFLSTLSFQEAYYWINEARPILREIDQKLLNLASPWLAVTGTLLTMSEPNSTAD